MARFSTQNGRVVGKGQHCPGGSVTDAELARAISRYKRGIASRYTALVPDEIDERLPPGPYLVSPKLDGEQWCLVLDDGDAFLANPNGRVLCGDLPVLIEAREAAKRAVSPTVIAGELFAVRKEGRARHGDLPAALSGEAKAEVDRIGFMAFDVVWGGDETARMPIPSYEARLETVQRVLGDGGKRLRPVKTERVFEPAEVAKLFETWAAGGKAEGLVVRTPTEHTFKVKPSITLDAAVIGYTQRSEDASQVSSLLLALIRPDGAYQIIGHCGNLGSEEERRKLNVDIGQLHCESNYAEANSRGALFQPLRPQQVVEVRISDVQADNSAGDIVPRMVLGWDDERGWVAQRRMAGVSILHPRLVRLRDDKKPIEADVPVRQVFERVLLPDVDTAASVEDLPPSELLRREVYTKVTKGKTAVRKLLLWKTNKEQADPAYPAFVVHFTDYSPGRKDPLKRTVRLAPSQDVATEIADEMIESQIKRGWKPA